MDATPALIAMQQVLTSARQTVFEAESALLAARGFPVDVIVQNDGWALCQTHEGPQVKFSARGEYALIAVYLETEGEDADFTEQLVGTGDDPEVVVEVSLDGEPVNDGAGLVGLWDTGRKGFVMRLSELAEFFTTAGERIKR